MDWVVYDFDRVLPPSNQSVLHYTQAIRSVELHSLSPNALNNCNKNTRWCLRMLDGCKIVTMPKHERMSSSIKPTIVRSNEYETANNADCYIIICKPGDRLRAEQKTFILSTLPLR